MNITQLNFLFIGTCLGYNVEKEPILGELLHEIKDLDWKVQVFNLDNEHFVVKESFLENSESKWQYSYFIVKKSTFSWNIGKEGNMIGKEFIIDEENLEYEDKEIS